MQSNHSGRSRAFWTRGLIVLGAVLGLGLMGRPAPAAPFAYVANSGANTVSVIDTATNMVVATVPVSTSGGVAITPDGKHAYVTNFGVFPSNGSVSVIATASNTVVATVPVGFGPQGVAITPDGKHAYVANFGNSVSVIDTATNTVVATVPVGLVPLGAVAITPNGQYAYVALTHVEVLSAIPGSGAVLVIATATNTVVGSPIPVGLDPRGVAVTPDGKHAYATASNTVIATVPVGGTPRLWASFRTYRSAPSAPSLRSNSARRRTTMCLCFSRASSWGALAIQFGETQNHDFFEIESSFTLGSTSSGIKPPSEPVTLQIGTFFGVTIPPGSFKGKGFGPFVFFGVINGVTLEALILPTGAKRFALLAAAQNANLTGTVNPVTVRLSIGANSGTTSVTADIDRDR